MTEENVSLGQVIDRELAKIHRKLDGAARDEEYRPHATAAAARMDEAAHRIDAFVRQAMPPEEWMREAMVVLGESESALRDASFILQYFVSGQDDE